MIWRERIKTKAADQISKKERDHGGGRSRETNGSPTPLSSERMFWVLKKTVDG